MKLNTLLTLGRTSNLPTVWSNVLCGAVLSGAPLEPGALAVAIFAGSAFYEGGMFLNDAFDADFDARERPDRPIAAGLVERGVVFRIGWGLLLLGLAALALAPLLGITHTGYLPAGAGLATCASVVAYNRWHKGVALSPVVMGLCRAGLYLMGGLVLTSRLEGTLCWASLAILLYIVGLTHIARFETGSVVDRAWPSAFVLAPLIVAAPFVARAWPIALPYALLSLACSQFSLRLALRGGKGAIPRAVVTLIAGASLADAMWIATRAAHLAALAALGCFLLTVRWQRRIRGT